jgi:hypothetical protein
LPSHIWAHRQNHATSASEKPCRPDSLDDLEIQRESERKGHKKPSKIFYDLFRWELHKIKKIMAEIRRQQLEAISLGSYDPLAIETIAQNDALFSDVTNGDVLRDPKIRPSGYVHPVLRTPSIERRQENWIQVIG